MPEPSLTPEDTSTLSLIEWWKRTVNDEVDSIGGWRDSEPDALARYWRKPRPYCPGEPRQAPQKFYTDTTYLAGIITAQFPKLDPTPLLDTYEAVAAWYADHNASRIAPQPALFATMERAMMTLQAMEQAVLARGRGVTIGGGVEGEQAGAKPPAASDAKGLDAEAVALPIEEQVGRLLASLDDAKRGPLGEPEGPKGERRRGRLTKEDGAAKRATLRALINEHATMKYDFATLGFQVGVSPATARRWVKAEDEAYRKSKAASPPEP